MSKKVVLLGLTVCEVMAASIATVFVSKENTEAFAGENTPSTYTATIDKDNRLIDYGMNNSFAFRLHNSEEYGEFVEYNNDWFDRNPAGDYVFSWDNKTGESTIFQIYLRELAESVPHIIDGKPRYLRGFPGAFEITTVYSLSDDSIQVGFRPGDGWTKTSPKKEGNLYTQVCTKKSSEASQLMSWCTYNIGVLYIKSITIKYTCPVANN